MSVNMMMDKFITLVIGAALLPTAFLGWFAANTTGWDATAILLWPIIGIVAIISILYAFLPRKR